MVRVEKKAAGQRRLVDDSETESESPVQPKRKAPKITIKKSAAATPLKRKPEYVTETERPKRQRLIRRSPPTVQSERTPPTDESETVKSLILKLIKDFEVFKQDIKGDIRKVSDRVKDATDEVWKLKAEVGRMSALLKSNLKRRGTDVGTGVDEDVIMVDETTETEKGKDDGEQGLREDDETEIDFDLSFLDEQRIPTSTEIELAKAETILTETTIADTITAKPPSWMVKNWYWKGKGKEVAEDILCGFKPYMPEIRYEVVNKEELLVVENFVLLD